MSYVPKENTGSIFRNDRKEKDTHPDGKGTALIDGVEYWISSWNSADKNGNPYRKLAFTRKEQSAPAPAYKKPSQDAAKARQLAPQREPVTYTDRDFQNDSDIPF